MVTGDIAEWIMVMVNPQTPGVVIMPRCSIVESPIEIITARGQNKPIKPVS
jgi:hypothetical protein